MAGGALILMYHRVAAPLVDPWRLSVSPGHFSEQLAALRTCADVVPLPRLLDHVPAAGRPAVAVTFDDGYVDNLQAATPVLERHDVPATVFVASGYVGRNRQYWWDELADLLLTPGTLPDTLELGVDGVTRRWTLGEAASYTAPHGEGGRTWRALDPPPTPRHALFAELWRLMTRMSLRRQEYLLNVLRGWTGAGLRRRAPDRPVTADELRALAAGGLIEIGAHSVTHPFLEGLPDEVQRAELQGSKAQLEALLDRPVEHFAYPYGSASPATVRMTAEAGFRCGCTTTPALVPAAPDRLRLPRFTVEDWDGDDFLRHLSGWQGE